MSKNQTDLLFVYSTNKQFEKEELAKQKLLLSPAEHKIKIQLDTKLKAGKSQTKIWGIFLSEENIAQLFKNLKNFCACGGVIKENEIFIQGDQRVKVLTYLQKQGYKHSKII